MIEFTQINYKYYKTFQCNCQSHSKKMTSSGSAKNCNLAGRYGSTPWLSLWESCQPNRLTERVPQ